MGFSRQEYWRELLFPTPGDLPDPGIEPAFLTLTGGFFTTSGIWEALHCHEILVKDIRKKKFFMQKAKKAKWMT